MSCPGNDFDLYLTAHLRTRLFVEINHDIILATHDEQGRCLKLSCGTAIVRKDSRFCR